MSSFRVRPRFAHTVELDPEETRSRIVQAFTTPTESFEVKAFPGFIGLHIGERERRFWSPRLFLVIEPSPDGKTLIHGTYGPEIEIWGIFLYGYLISGLLGTFSGALGFAQLTISAQPWGFWVLGGMVTIAGLLYLGAQLGQKFGAWQTFQMHQAYQTAIGRPAELT